MSNLFNDTLPTEYEYGGRVYEFQTDFREWIKFELLLTDRDIAMTDKARRLTEIIFPTVPPDEKLWEFLLWFYKCGREPPKAKPKSGRAKKQTAVYSFEYDDGYIFAAFLEVYGIDLCEVQYLHWWKFKAMFRALHDCKLTDIMGYRSEELNSKTPEYRKKFVEDMKRLYALPRSLSEQQKIDELKRIKKQAGY